MDVCEAASSSQSGAAALIANEIDLLDHAQIVVGELTVSEGGPTQVELLHHRGCRSFRLEIWAPAGYPAAALSVNFEPGEGWPGSLCRAEQIRLAAWQEQMKELAKDAASHQRGCLEGLCGLFTCAAEDLSLVTGNAVAAAPSMVADSIDLSYDVENSPSTPPPVYYVHLVALNHQHSFSVPFADFLERPQALGRMPSCKMWLDHPFCSKHQLRLRAVEANCLELQAQVLSPMLVGAWLQPGAQTTVKSGDVLAIRMDEPAPLMVWQLHITEAPAAPAPCGAKLIPLHRPSEELLLGDWTSLGAPPSFKLWSPQLALQRTASGVAATVERKADGTHLLRRLRSTKVFHDLEQLQEGQMATLTHGSLICVCERKFESDFSRCTWFVFQDVGRPPRLIPSPCRRDEVASPNALTMTVQETMGASVAWGRSDLPTEPEGDPGPNEETDVEKAKVCRRESSLWDEDLCPEAAVAVGSGTGSTGLPSQEAAEPLQGSRDSSFQEDTCAAKRGLSDIKVDEEGDSSRRRHE